MHTAKGKNIYRAIEIRCRWEVERLILFGLPLPSSTWNRPWWKDGLLGRSWTSSQRILEADLMIFLDCIRSVMCKWKSRKLTKKFLRSLGLRWNVTWMSRFILPKNEVFFTFLLNRMNWLRIAIVSKYWEKAQPKSAQTDRLRFEWKSNANTAAAIIKYHDFMTSKSRL